MGRSSILVILFVCLLSFADAQEAISFRQADSATYAAYISGDWDGLISQGKLALDNDVDYFYLRLRMGAAYFNKHNYRAASKQFYLASEFNPANGVTNEYRYYSYLYSGRYNEAAYVAAKMNPLMHEITGISKPSFLTSVNFEFRTEFSDNIEQNSLGQLPRSAAQQWQDLYGSSMYAQLGLSMRLHPRISMYLGYSFLGIEKQAELQHAWNELDSIVEHEWGFAKFFPSVPRIEYQKYEYSLQQHEIYANAGIFLGKGWTIHPAIHYVNVNTKSIGIENRSHTIQDTAYYITDLDSVAYFYYERIDLAIDARPLVLNNVVLSLGLNKQISVFNLGLFGSWSNLNDLKQVQFGFKAAYYPFGNLNLYGSTTIKGISEEGELWGVFGQTIGIKVTKFLWAEAYGVFGNLRGTNELNAFIVYNISDQINLKTGVNLTFVLSPSVQLTARYQYLKKTGYRYMNGPQQAPGDRVQELDYTNQSILGGLKWIF